MRHCRSGAVAAVACIVAVSCGGERSWVRAVERSATTTTAEGDQWSAPELVTALAADELQGRDNLTAGSALAQELLVAELSQFAQPVEGNGYLQPFAQGTNVIGVIPGGDLADEYVVIGAHYDHIGTSCRSSDPADQVCNGATDNASGVAAVIAIGRAIAAAGPPRRTVVVALWDAEEDGLLGSAAYVAQPVAALDRTVAYLNFDIQGATPIPSLADVTLAIGAETGGEPLAAAVANAASTASLQVVTLHTFMFQGRSDHASFGEAGVPAMLFTDATGGCYHTAQDQTEVVDVRKLDQQIAIGTALVRQLANADGPPLRITDPPRMTFADVDALLVLTGAAESDLDLLGPGARADVQRFIADLRAIAADGPAQFDATAMETVLVGVDVFVDALTTAPCVSVAA